MTRVARGAAKASMVEGGVRCKHQGEEEESTSQMGGRRVVGAQPTNRLTKPENSSRIKKWTLCQGLLAMSHTFVFPRSNFGACWQNVTPKTTTPRGGDAKSRKR